MARRLDGFEAKPSRRRVATATATEVPAVLDLLAACLLSGASVESALRAVADAFAGPTGELLIATARLMSLGAPVETAWARCLDTPGWAGVGRAAVRAHYSGSALSDIFSRMAGDSRRRLRSLGGIAAARAGVRIVLPLGVCFLPAFVLLGVVPVIAGFAGALWGAH